MFGRGLVAKAEYERMEHRMWYLFVRFGMWLQRFDKPK